MVLGLLVIAVLWCGVGYKYMADRRDARRESDRANESYALVFEENLLRALGEIDKSLLYMRRTLEGAHASRLYESLANTKDLLSDIIVQVAIIDADGIMRASSAGPQPPPPLSLADRPHFRVHLDGGPDRLYIGAPLVGRASGRLSVQCSRRFLRPDGRFGGVVVASLDPNHLTRLYDGVDFGSRSAISLIGEDGIVRSNGGAAGGYATGTDVSGTAVFERIKAGNGGTFELPDLDSRGERVVTLRKVKGQPLWITAIVPRADIYREAGTAFKVDAAAALALSLLVSLVMLRLVRIENRRSEAEAEVLRLALRDPLTDLPNRRVFRMELQKAVEGVRDSSGGASCALLLLDLDRFKIVNDTLGHGIGDALLTMMGRRLAAVLGHDHVLSRLGGDEFAVVVPRFMARSDLDALAARIVEVAARPFDIDKHRVASGVSIGVAIGPADGANADDLMIAADLALYAAKGNARGNALYYDRAMSDGLAERRQMESDLREALAAGTLELHFQPSISVETGAIASFEALARWPDGARGSVPPSIFIAVAEETGLIHELGEWAMAEACRIATGWPEGIKVAVNLSPVQFAGVDLVATVRGVLARTGLPARRLELEITEQMLLDNGERTIRTLKSLKALGISIAMDDFGTGYSSLNYLRDFPFDRVKIDRSFVAALGRGAQHVALVRAVIDIARSFGMATTAEGVETREQRDMVAALGCGDIQGFFYTRPLPAAAVQPFIAGWRTSSQLAA